MKRTLRILLAAVLIACMLILSSAAEERTGASIHWRHDLTLKYIEDASVNQLIAVQYTGGYSARIIMFEKSYESGKPVWTQTLLCSGIVGMNGVGKEKEGDNKTPVGDFGAITAFGIKENPGTRLNYIDVTKDTYCCGDEHFYNQIIDISEHPHDCSNGERMIEYSPEYNYGIFLDYNKERVFGEGSAIFFHCTGAQPYTAGCVAVDERDMIAILRAVDSGVRIVIDYIE